METVPNMFILRLVKVMKRKGGSKIFHEIPQKML